MNIVTTTSVYPPGYPSDQALLRLAKIGFSHLDMAFDYCTQKDHPFMQDDWRLWVESLKGLADRTGVRYTHAHSPGNTTQKSEVILRCIEACHILGISYLVIHPAHKIGDEIITDRNEFIRVNREGVRKLLPYAEKNGITILSENLLWGASTDPLLIAELVKAVDNPFFGWCFDTGHAHCSAVPISSLHDAAVLPLSLHIQDNSGKPCKDEHLMPGDGGIDWKEFLILLSEIGYKGELVLEAHHQSLESPDSERDLILSELLNRAKKMNAYSEKLKASL